jgi:hypothetical protein
MAPVRQTKFRSAGLRQKADQILLFAKTILRAVRSGIGPLRQSREPMSRPFRIHRRKVMRRLLPALALAFVATAATAQVGPPTSQRSCGANRQLVLKDGAVVLDTGPSTYARFVKSGAECLVGQFPEPAWVPSSNNPQCFIGYRCKDGSDDF